MAGAAADVSLFHEVTRFLFHEAALLDERRFDEWVELFDAKGEYWVPMTWGQADPHHHVSLIYETLDVLRMRVRRLQDKTTLSQRPPSRTCHQIANVRVEEPADNEVLARSVLTLVEYRRDEQRLFAGHAQHRLRRDGDTFRILAKRVDILNCDADTGHIRISVPF